MRVLFLVSAFPRYSGDVITPWLTQTIRHLASRGVTVEVLAPAHRGLVTQELEGIIVHRFRYAPRRWETLTHEQTAPDRIREKPWFVGLVPGYVLAGSVAAARLARGGRFDVIHAFWPIPHGLLGLAAKRAAHVPLVSTFFGVELTWLEGQLPFLAPLLKRIVRGSDAVTVISSYTAGRLERLVPGVRPVVIPFGAAINAPPVQTEPSRDEEHGGVPKPFELLFVGRLVERKGVHVLLDALARLKHRSPVRVRVVGDGPERPALEDQAARLQLGARAVFEGFVSSAALAARFASCDAFVLPAVVDVKGDTEGLGVVLLEAMTHGKAVIASAAGGIVDIVRDGQNGWLVPPRDADALAAAITECAENPERRAIMGARGRGDAEARFGWPVIVDQLSALYRRVGNTQPT